MRCSVRMWRANRHRFRRQNHSYLNSTETGDAFAVACAGLGNETDLADLAHQYGLTELKPICGFNAPNKVDFSNIQD